MINILTEQNVRKQLASLGPRDVLISPDLGALSASDFTQGADFIRLGEEAARAALPQLSALALAGARVCRLPRGAAQARRAGAADDRIRRASRAPGTPTRPSSRRGSRSRWAYRST